SIGLNAAGTITFLAGALGSPKITLNNASNIDILSQSLVRILGSGNAIFQFDTSTSITKLTMFGQTSGSAALGVAAAAGTPNPVLIPQTTGTSGQVLQTDGGSPNQQTSWVTAPGTAFPITVTAARS